VVRRDAADGLNGLAHGFEQLRIPPERPDADDVHAVIAHLLRDLHGIVRVFQKGTVVIRPGAPAPDGKHAGGEDLVRLAAGRFVHCGLQSAIRRGHQRGNAMRQLEVVHVLDGHGLLPQVHVQIDHTRHDGHALRVNHAVAGRPIRVAAALGRHGIKRHHLSNRVALDDDVVRPHGGPAVPRNHHGAADDEPVVRPGG
jgi:hypothetical protein